MNQTTISPKENVTLLLVVVPKDAKYIYVKNFTKGPSLLKWNNYENGWIAPATLTYLPLPHAHYVIIGLASKISEEQAKELVEEDEFGYPMFDRPDLCECGYQDAYESLISLIESSDLTIGKDQDCLILKIN